MNIAPGRGGGSTSDDDEQEDTGASSSTSSGGGASSSGASSGGRPDAGHTRPSRGRGTSGSSSSASSSDDSSSGARPDAGDTRPSRGRDTAGTTTPSTDAFEEQTQATDEPRSDAGHTTPDDEGGSPTRDIEAGETDDVAASRAVERSSQVQSAQRRGEDPDPAGGRRREAGETDDAAARAATERSGQLQDAQRRRDQFRSDVADEIDGVEEDDLRLVQQDGEIVAELDASDDDLPRVSDVVEGGGADFRQDSSFRSFSQDVAERGAGFGGSLFAGGIRAAGGDDSDQRVGQAAGASIGGLPGSVGLVTADINDAVVSTRGTGDARESAAQARDIGVDAGDFVLGGLDRTFDVDAERRESGEGALVEFDETGTRGEETAGALFGGALLLGASGPASAGARAATARAPSTSGAGQSLGRLASDTRAQGQIPRGRQRERDTDRFSDDGVQSGRDFERDLRQQELSQDQAMLRDQAQRERTAQRDLVDDPAGSDPIAGGGRRGPTFDPDAPQPTGPSRFAEQRSVGQDVPRGFADLDRAGNVPRTDLRATTTPTRQSAAASGRFSSGALAASGAVTAGPRQPNPGGLVVDDRGQVRDNSQISGVEEDTSIGGVSQTSDDLLGTQEVESETTDGVTGVGTETDADTDTGRVTGFELPPRQDTGTTPRGDQDTGTTPRGDQDTGTRPGSRPDTRPAQRGQTAQRGGQRTGQRPAVSDLIPGQQQRTQSRPVTRPTGRPNRPRPPSIDFDFDTSESRETFGAEAGSSFERGAAGGPAVGFGAETFDALARGAFAQRELPDDIGIGPSAEIPTAALVDPDEEEEEGVSFVSDLFGLDDDTDSGTENAGFPDFGFGGGRRDS